MDFINSFPGSLSPGQPVHVVPPPEPPVFVPTFETVTVKSTTGIGGYAMNQFMFADDRTAEYLAVKFGAVGVVKEPVLPPGGPYTALDASGQPAHENRLLFRNGVTVGAGQIAYYYLAGPEDKFPGWADQRALALIKAEGAK